MASRGQIFTLGIEEEFQIIDPETRELRSHIQKIIARSKMTLKQPGLRPARLGHTQ